MLIELVYLDQLIDRKAEVVYLRDFGNDYVFDVYRLIEYTKVNVGIFYHLKANGVIEVDGQDLSISIVAICAVYLFVAFYSISWVSLYLSK